MKALLILAVGLLVSCSSSQSLIKSNFMDDWTTENGGSWKVEDGILYGEKKASNPKHCILVSKTEYQDFKLTMDYHAEHGNSGFYFRLLPENNKVGYKGYHAEIDSKGKNAAGIYDVAVDWISQPDAALIKKAFKANEWNTMVIEAVGEQIDITLNGHKMTSLKSSRSARGKLGVQLHANENTRIQFKNLQITEL